MYEKIFSNGEPITTYSACSHAEGFCEGENASAEDQIKAWSFLIGMGICWTLRGWYGRCAASLIDAGTISADGAVNWDFVNEKLNNE
jgi:hypothetical protein